MVNDISIIVGIMTIFVLIGVCMPFVNESFNIQGSSTIQVDNLQDQIGEDASELTEDMSVRVNAFSVFASVAQMFYWGFGSFPFWLSAIFWVMRVTLILILARNIWIGGGA